VTTLVRFAPALGEWIQQHLSAGRTAHELLETMQEKMSPEAARAIVDGFVNARAAGTLAPIDCVTLLAPTGAPLPEAIAEYRYGTSRLRQGGSIATTDRVVRVSSRLERPVLAVLNDVFSGAECADLIEMARRRLTPSTIVDPKTGCDVVTGLRTSHGMFFRPMENAFIARLDQRLAEIMNFPVEHGEGLQVLRYAEGASSAPHFDFLVPSNPANQTSIARSGQRMSTLVTYLNDVPAGGETIFPEAGWSVSPHRGSAVYFEYCNSDGQLDHASLHGGQKVRQGEKWVATKWMRARPFVPAPPILPRGATDLRTLSK
jgi:prolyl 4-hydroxylase